MTLLSPPYALGAAGQVLSGKLLRHSLGAAWRPGSAALSAVSGVLSGPAGSMMELTLVNATTINVNPGVAVVQGTQSADQGQYEVPNDALVALAVTGQHASQYRRSLVLIEVNDSQAAGVASSATADRARLYVLDGPLSATNPAPLPTVPANSLLLGEVSIPPAGQTVGLTPYNPRTVPRGGIQPVAADSSTVPGHGSEPGVYSGQYRDHPVSGLQRWDGSLWGDPLLRPMVRVRRSTDFAHTQQNAWVPIPMQVADINVGGMWSTANLFDVFATRAGIYRVGGGTFMTGTPQNGRTIVKISKFHASDSTWRETWIGRGNTHGSGDGFDPGAETHGLLYLAQNDRIRLDVWQDVAASVGLGTQAWQPTFIEAEYIRP